MMTAKQLSITTVLVLAINFSLGAQENKPDFEVPNELTYRTADIMSEGTRMSAEVFAPKDPAEGKLPTIIMCHGWGGIARYLRPDAIVFAKAGYLVVDFDYRGWGNSDARLILAQEKLESRDGKLLAEVKEVREVVDPTKSARRPSSWLSTGSTSI